MVKSYYSVMAAMLYDDVMNNAVCDDVIAKIIINISFVVFISAVVCD